MMIDRSWRASPGGVSACRPSCTSAVGVGERAGFFRERRRGQDHVGQVTGLGEKDILDDEHLELRQRLARVPDVRIGHRRVLAHDVHAADVAGVDRIHDLDNRQPRLFIQRRAPQRLEFPLRPRVVDAPIVRIHHRDQAGVARALDVVLAAQRMQAGAGPADLAGEHRQRDEAARVVGAVHVLRNAHAPEDHRCGRRREHARHRADRFRVDAADRRHQFRAERRDVVADRLETAGAVGDEALGDQAFLDDRVHHRVQQRDVGVGFELQVVRRVPRELGAARIGEDQPRSVLRGVLDPGRGDRMVDHRIGADQQHDVRLHHVHHRVGHGAGPDAFEQRGDARCMAQPRAVVDVVGSEAGAHELLEQVRFLVAAFRRAEARERVRTARVADALQRPLATAIASSHVASRNTVSGSDGSIVKSADFAMPSRRISGLVSRCGCET